MYNPKKIFTKEGYEDYLAHLRNIENGLFYIENHMDDLHIGADDINQSKYLYNVIRKFRGLLPVLKKGDGEKYDNR